MPTRSVRVLQILGELRPSGAEVMLAAAAEFFEAHGVSIDVLSTGDQVGRAAGQLAEAGCRVHHLPFRKHPSFFWGLWRLCRNRYDAIHIHTERGGFWVGLTALSAGAGVVLRSIHSTYDFSGFLRVRRAAQRRILEALGVRHVAISESVRRTELQRFGLRTELIPNWFDTARFIPPSDETRRACRAALGLEGDRFVVATVGNCSPIKNHQELIRALSLIPPDERPVYLHVGEEEDASTERELVERLGLEPTTRFLGPLDDVRPVLYASDGFAMPSVKEGFGIAALEAIATGLPAVLCDVPGLSDLRLHFDGLIYCSPTADSLQKALRSLSRMPLAERRSLASRNSDAAQTRYSLERGALQYIAIYVGQRTTPTAYPEAM
jgi:glycosyltransferase involved in cell wall biosynthesis